MLLAALTGGALGAVLYGLIFGPLQRRGSQALLIATIGLGIALGEALRLLSRLAPALAAAVLHATVALDGGSRHRGSTSGQLLLAAAGAGDRRRRRLATAAGPHSAAPIGPAPTIRRRRPWSASTSTEPSALTCVLGSTLAAVAGFVIATHYGIVSFAMGALWGFKALTAAVVGGIGSVPGAALGGVLIGLLESSVGRLPAQRLPARWRCSRCSR